jgi:hypothetical protein
MKRLLFAAAVFGLAVVWALSVTSRSAVADDKGQGAWGTVKGRVVLDADTVPDPKELNVDKDKDCCLAKGPVYSEELVVNKKNKGVRWVFVWLAPFEKDGEPLKKTIHPTLQKLKKDAEEMDQPNCQFIPHAIGLREGQTLVTKNSATVAHNVHWFGYPIKNPGGNVIVPAGQKFDIKDLKADKYPITIQCDIHGWMKAYARVFDHPYFAVTDKDGNFEIKLAPAGKYRLMAWQDKGWVNGDRDGKPIVIPEAETLDLGQIKMKPPEEGK